MPSIPSLQCPRPKSINSSSSIPFTVNEYRSCYVPRFELRYGAAASPLSLSAAPHVIVSPPQSRKHGYAPDLMAEDRVPVCSAQSHPHCCCKDHRCRPTCTCLQTVVCKPTAIWSIIQCRITVTVFLRLGVQHVRFYLDCTEVLHVWLLLPRDDILAKLFCLILCSLSLS